MPVAVSQKRAEARTRYYTRDEAQRVGWDVRHPSKGGSFLEEQEIVDYFPALKEFLGSERPDFVAIASDAKLRMVIECKKDYRELDKAVQEACDYSDSINEAKGFDVRVAVGVAGTPDTRVLVRASYRLKQKWVTLTSHKFPLTQLPTPRELQTAIENEDGATDVQLPDEREFFVAAVSISRFLRLAKIEEAVRPKVIGAIILALYQGELPLAQETVIEHINANVRAAVNKFDDVPKERRDFLADTLKLSTEAHRLRSKIGDIVHQLERLNVRSIMRSGVDFLGQFYETFLRYGQDAKKLGIVFTPRHITRYCAELVDVKLGMNVYDPACGTGGFLVAAFDKMMAEATTEKAKAKVKQSLWGCDTNSTVWVLAVLNMFFRGDGKSHIIFESCFDQETGSRFQRALLNPPFSQEGEPETDFIDHALATLEPGGQLAVVVKTSVLVDPTLAKWRRTLVANHHVLGVMSLPSELFYPTAAPTVILIVKAHAPDMKLGTFLARIQNDGFEISKNRRIPVEGSQLGTILNLYREFLQKGTIKTIPNVAMVIDRSQIVAGEEICAEQWLPSSPFGLNEFETFRLDLMRQVSLAVANNPEAVDELVDDYEEQLGAGKTTGLPTKRGILFDWFKVQSSKSTGSKNYPPGPIPYVSSGDSYNGIVEFVEPPEDEIYDRPVISVSGFGKAYIQPWRFCARGNGGSAVRILSPRFAMTLAEMLWFAAQINSHRWRFNYGRMAIVPRLQRLEVDLPPAKLPAIHALPDRLRDLRRELSSLTAGGVETPASARFAEFAAEWERDRPRGADVEAMSAHPSYQRIIGMGERAVPLILSELRRKPGHWFWALHAITGENPVRKQAEGNIKSMAEDWIKWGKARGYIRELD